MTQTSHILKLLLDRDFYQSHKAQLTDSMFPDEIGGIYRTICQAQEKYARDLTIEEIKQLHFASNPTLTRAQKNNVYNIFEDLEELPAVGPDVAKDILSQLWKIEINRQIGEIAVKGMEGADGTLQQIESIITRVGDDFIPQENYDVVPYDLDDLIELLDEDYEFKFNINALADKIPGMGRGQFLIAFARTNVGKTLAHVSWAMAPNGWCWQGYNVLVVTNEEKGSRTKWRAVTAACQKPKEWILANKEEALAVYNQVKDRYTVLDAIDFSISDLDAYCRKYRPDVVICDQLDKIKISGTFAANHEKLGAIYTEAREIAKRYDCLMVGINQASAEAEGKTFGMTTAMMEGSRTRKGSEGDLILAISKYPTAEGADEDYTRIITSLKNKLNAWHGSVACVIDPFTSTFRD